MNLVPQVYRASGGSIVSVAGTFLIACYIVNMDDILFGGPAASKLLDSRTGTGASQK